MPLRVLGYVLGKWSAEVKQADEPDVVITINRPDRTVLPAETPGMTLPQQMEWVLEGRTLRFAHFAAD
jgi:hypothetical protein